jgi:chromosome segregation ATPase
VAYQKDIANLVEAEKLIENAIKVLQSFYDKMEVRNMGFIQKEDPTPPEVLAAGPQSGKGNAAIKMLEYILEETKKEENDAHSAEKTAQHDYEDSMEELTTEQAKMERALVALKEALATAEESLQQAEEDHKATFEDKLAIEAYLEKIKPGCDFITKNFGVRSKNRIIEKAALEEAQKALKSSPAYKKAVNEATVESYGKCKEPCVKDSQDVECKACMADVTIPGYCAGHPLTKGCNEEGEP